MRSRRGAERSSATPPRRATPGPRTVAASRTCGTASTRRPTSWKWGSGRSTPMARTPVGSRGRSLPPRPRTIASAGRRMGSPSSSIGSTRRSHPSATRSSRWASTARTSTRSPTWSVDGNDPDWSPDGTEIAFNASAEPSPTQNIWTIHPDGTGLTQLTTYDEDGQATFHPSWSPDGSRILFSHSPSTDGWGDFFVMDRDGSNQRVIAHTAIHENHGQWGPSPAP